MEIRSKQRKLSKPGMQNFSVQFLWTIIFNDVPVTKNGKRQTYSHKIIYDHSISS